MTVINRVKLQDLGAGCPHHPLLVQKSIRNGLKVLDRGAGVSLAPGLKGSSHDSSRTLAVRHDCQRKIKFVRCGSAENVKSALCGLYISCPVC